MKFHSHRGGRKKKGKRRDFGKKGGRRKKERVMRKKDSWVVEMLWVSQPHVRKRGGGRKLSRIKNRGGENE